MPRNPILDWPLTTVMRSEIALHLQQVLHVYTVGNFLAAWRNPENHRRIEEVFDTPQQARHAAAVCAGWLGVRVAAAPVQVAAWWRDEPSTQLPA
jgi:hypothetical protein